VKNLSFVARESEFRGACARGTWTLCLGAGLSRGIAPDWSRLTLDLLNQYLGRKLSEDAFAKLTQEHGWSLDGWIQASLNAHLLAGGEQSEFHKTLRRLIYGPLLERAEVAGLRSEVIRCLHDPFHVSPKVIHSVSNFFEAEYGETSVVKVAHFLLDAHEIGKEPDAIVTLNADCILDLLLTLFNMQRGLLATPPEHYRPSRYFRVMGSAEDFRGRTPVFHLHGALLPWDGAPHRFQRSDAPDRLIFEESAYAEASASIYNWAQTTFLYRAQFDRLVFLGMSMSDPNIRRWLAWSHKHRIDEIGHMSHRPSSTPTRSFDPHPNHFWLRTRPSSTDVDAIIEPSLFHLGVKIIWLDAWTEVRSALDDLVAR
jgi:hypothetical protein